MHDGEDQILWDVVEEHLDEAEFLWEAWEHSLVAPNYTLDEVAEGPEKRLAAHIDGLVVNGPLVVRRLLIPALEDDEPGRVSAAATALLLGPESEAGLEAILEALCELPEQRAPLVRALECAAIPGLRPRLRGLLTDGDLAVVAAAAAALTFNHEPLGEALGLLLASEEPWARTMALRAVAGEPDWKPYLPAVQASLQDYDPTIVDAAIDAGVRLGLAPAWARARERARDSDGADAMLLLALRGAPEDGAMLVRALQDRKLRHPALWALGFLATPEAVDASLEWLEDKVAGPLAGEVFSAITGVDLEDTQMTVPSDREDEHFEHRPEDDLPHPDPMAVLNWWVAHRGEFADGQRYLAGSVRDTSRLQRALRAGPMRRRPGHLLDLVLALPSRGRPRLQVRAPTVRQKSDLSAF